MQIPGEGGHLPGPWPPLPVLCGGAAPTDTPADALWGSQLQRAHQLPLDPLAKAPVTVMSLCLSPPRLDAPYFSCLVSSGPGGQGGMGRFPLSPLTFCASVFPAAFSITKVFL